MIDTAQIDDNSTLLRFKIDNVDVFIEELGENKGKIIISEIQGHNYSMYWGAMGGSLKEFLVNINSDYFANKLLGSTSLYSFDVKGTFKNVRKFIREDLDLPYYKHMEFQKNFREKLKRFEEYCEETNNERIFVDNFSYYFSTMPDFYLINDRWERERIESDFKNIQEPWNFITTKESDETKWLKKIHLKIKNKIKK